MRPSDYVLDHLLHPRHSGGWPENTPFVATGQAGRPGLGDVVRLQLKWDRANRTIEAVRFKAHGSAFAIASASWLAERLEHCLQEEACTLSSDSIVEALSLPTPYLHCADLVIQALRRALQNYPPP